MWNIPRNTSKPRVVILTHLKQVALRFLIGSSFILNVAQAAAGEVEILNVPDFVVSCSTTGQACEPGYSASFNVAASSQVKAQYFVTAPCSSLKVSFFIDGKQIYTSGFLSWPGATGELAKLPTDTGAVNLGTVTAGEHVLMVKAEGQSGGCNSGGLGMWGGKLRVTSETPMCADKHAVFDTKTGIVSIPAIDIQTLNPITGEPTGKWITIKGQLKLLDGVEDFSFLSETLEVIKPDVATPNVCHATYHYTDGKFSSGGELILPIVDVPSIIVIPPNIQIPGPTNTYNVRLLQLAKDNLIFHLLDYYAYQAVNSQ
jgi:hypothetical protein